MEKGGKPVGIMREGDAFASKKKELIEDAHRGKCNKGGRDRRDKEKERRDRPSSVWAKRVSTDQYP